MNQLRLNSEEVTHVSYISVRSQRSKIYAEEKNFRPDTIVNQVPRRSLLAHTTLRVISWRHQMAYLQWRHDISHQVESSEREENAWVLGWTHPKISLTANWKSEGLFGTCHHCKNLTNLPEFNLRYQWNKLNLKVIERFLFVRKTGENFLPNETINLSTAKPRIHPITVTTLIKEHGTSMTGQMEQ